MEANKNLRHELQSTQLMGSLIEKKLTPSSSRVGDGETERGERTKSAHSFATNSRNIGQGKESLACEVVRSQ